MDFLIPLVKDWEGTPKTKTIGINLKRKDKKKVTEHLLKGVRNTNVVSDANDGCLILKENIDNACGRVLHSNFAIKNLLGENKLEIRHSLPEISPSVVLDENYD